MIDAIIILLLLCAVGLLFWIDDVLVRIHNILVKEINRRNKK